MCYALSEKSIAFRFFKPVRAFPQRFVQDFTNVDYTRDMAIAAVVQGSGGEQIVGVGHYFLNQATNRAEVSFLVRDDWQAKGIGTYLLEILTDIAAKRGVAGIEASVLTDNHSMLAVFYNSGYSISTRKEENVYEITYDLRKPVSKE
jgi:GNAT superfamily N-acetyltransferase